MSDDEVARLADWFMDLRLSGPAEDGWTYQETAQHYARLLLTGSLTQPAWRRDRLAWAEPGATLNREDEGQLLRALAAVARWSIVPDTRPLHQEHHGKCGQDDEEWPCDVSLLLDVVEAAARCHKGWRAVLDYPQGTVER